MSGETRRTVKPAEEAQTPPARPRIAASATLPLPTRLLSTYAVRIVSTLPPVEDAEDALLALPGHYFSLKFPSSEVDWDWDDRFGIGLCRFQVQVLPLSTS